MRLTKPDFHFFRLLRTRQKMRFTIPGEKNPEANILKIVLIYPIFSIFACGARAKKGALQYPTFQKFHLRRTP